MPEKHIADEVSTFYKELLLHAERANIVADAQQRHFIKYIVYYRTAIVLSDSERYYKGVSDVGAPFLGILLDKVDPGWGERFMQRYIEQRDTPQRIHALEYREAVGIINRINFDDLLPFLNDVEKLGLTEANMKWREKPIVARKVM